MNQPALLRHFMDVPTLDPPFATIASDGSIEDAEKMIESFEHRTIEWINKARDLVGVPQ